MPLFALSLVYQVLRKRGLGEVHFRWPVEIAKQIRRSLHWFTPTVVVLLVLVHALDSRGDESANASLGRVLFTAQALATALFLHRVVRPNGAFARRLLAADRNGWAQSLRHIWHVLIVAVPIALIALSWLGFHYTALQLESRLEQSLAFGFLVVLGYGLIMRWLFIARRRVAVDDAKRRRERQRLDAEATRASSESSTPEVRPIEVEKLDLPAMNQQTRGLVRTIGVLTIFIGLYLIWAEALPALRMLNRVQVWPSVKLVEGHSANGAGRLTGPVAPARPATDAQPGSASSPDATGGVITPLASGGAIEMSAASPGLTLTLADLGLVILIFVITWVLFRNLPGLVEIIVLQRLPLDSGSRYALSTVLRYTIAIIGVLIASSVLGLSWSNIQWLAAALTFGLAFGLQEIFANFISGLIILAERPIRIGDTVTVGGVTGSVARIRMRATTIVDWDRKELVIPNKTFITGDIINWTLSDPVLRVIIPVGVSYGSDVDKVEQMLMKVASECPLVLDEPTPRVLFDGFGDSTLNFELRVYIGSIDDWFPVRHRLHNMITKTFREAEIEIAFPQRDLHIRSAGGLTEFVRPLSQEEEPEPPQHIGGAPEESA